MNALTKLAAKQHLTQELTKVALKMSDVEDHMGVYLDKKHHGKVRKMIEEKKGKSFALRHPLLTGIPTLGLAPLIAKEQAADRIKRELVREDKGLRKAHEKAMDKRHKQQTEREQANAPARAASSLGAAYIVGRSI